LNKKKRRKDLEWAQEDTSAWLDVSQQLDGGNGEGVEHSPNTC